LRQSRTFHTLANGPKSGVQLRNPRAKNLIGKELLIEFAWCENYAENLSRFTQHLGAAIAFPDRYAWPEQPKILSRENFSGESRRS
jgi:hypothetical protein